MKVLALAGGMAEVWSRQMNCPACDSILGTKVYHGMMLDVCPTCSGVWFDQRELGDFIDLYLENHEDLPDSAIELDKTVICAWKADEATRRCPGCRQPLKKLNYAYDSNIILDQCSSCNRTWVDGPEVKQLAIYAKGNPKLTKMGASIVKHVAETQQNHELTGAAQALGSTVGIWLFLPKIILPIGDDTKRRRFPAVTLGIVLINVAVLVWMFTSFDDWSPVFAALGFVPKIIMTGQEHFRFITAIFLHSGVLHLLSNSLFLLIFGDNVEDAFGHIRFAAFYLLCGVAGALAFLLPHMASEIPGIGASGAISGVMGAYFVLYPKARVRTFVIFTVISIRAYAFLGIWFAFQLLFCFMYGAHESIGFSAHAGGFAAGIAIALCYRMLKNLKARRAQLDRHDSTAHTIPDMDTARIARA